jgi:acyl-ACP thioesterase
LYQYKTFISNNDVDFRFELKVTAIFRLFQDAAMLATQDRKADSISLAKRNIDWVITRMDVEIIRLPKCNEEITIITYPGKDLMMVYPRHFLIKDQQGTIIIRASSLWALIDATTRKVLTGRDVISRLEPETTKEELPLPSKILMPEEKYFFGQKVIRYSDIDFNCHMNNVRYVELLMDVNDFTFYKSNRPSLISLNYIKEIKEKDTVNVFTNGVNPQYVEVQVDNSPSFIGKVTFVER